MALVAAAAGCGSGGVPRAIPAPIFGVTVDSVANLDQVVRSLDGFSRTLTARIVFDAGTPARDYLRAVETIGRHAYVMGQPCDSSYLRHVTVARHRALFREYWRVLGNRVDLWEIGNEVNGEWCGWTPDTVAKITDAARFIKSRGGRTALTLFYNQGCTDVPEREMFTWLDRHLGTDVRRDVDYAFVSMYESECQKPPADWTPVFRRLAAAFPGAQVGFGEVGLEKPARAKAAYLRRYYRIRPDVPGFVGGYFWWFFVQDCVPREKPLWRTLRAAVNGG